MQEIILAIALVLVIEGFLPAINPGAYRRTIQKMMEFEDRHMRIWGIFSMVSGAVLVYIFA